MINLQNYEEYFVRYIDRECSPAEIAAVESFLHRHPTLHEDLNALRGTVLVPEQVFFPSKEKLKKGISTVNYESYFSRKVDGDLSPAELMELDAFIDSHPELIIQLKGYEATMLSPDISVVFPDKNRLKKRKERVVSMYLRYGLLTAVAACLMLIVMMRSIYKQPVEPPVITGQVSQPSSELQQDSSAADKLNGRRVNGSNQLASVNSHESAESATPHKPAAMPRNLQHEFSDVLQSDLSQSQLVHPVDHLTEQAEMINKIDNDVKPIAYKATVRKAAYRKPLPAPYNTYAQNDHKATTKITTVAAALGGELLRLSGREDYLKTSSAFNESAAKQKLPLAVSIKGSRFNFYHIFFKKRKHSSSLKQN